jgi:hypothetical protein
MAADVLPRITLEERFGLRSHPAFALYRKNAQLEGLHGNIPKWTHFDLGAWSRSRVLLSALSYVLQGKVC